MSDTFNSVFSRRLAYFMELNNVTQKQLAEELNVSEASVSYWLKGQKVPRADKVDKICRFLNCKRSDLVDDSSNRAPDLSPFDKQFIANYHQLDPENQGLVDSLIKLLQQEQPPLDKAMEMIGRLSRSLHS